MENATAEQSKNDHLYIRWSTYDIIKSQAEYIVEEDPSITEDQAFQNASEDYDIFTWAWDELIDDLDQKMAEYNPDGKRWDVRVENFGWRNLSGRKVFDCDNAKQFLREVLPDTDNTFNIFMFDDEKRMEIQNFHHDSPTGEWYYISLYDESDDVDSEYE